MEIVHRSHFFVAILVKKSYGPRLLEFFGQLAGPMHLIRALVTAHIFCSDKEKK
jgi:hypothetical protein